MTAASRIRGVFDFFGEANIFGFQALRNLFTRKLEFQQVWSQLDEVGLRSLPLIAASGLALGIVMTLHTRSTLVEFGAGAMSPSVQSLTFFNELAPLVTGLLVLGRASRRNSPTCGLTSRSTRSRHSPSIPLTSK